MTVFSGFSTVRLEATGTASSFTAPADLTETVVVSAPADAGVWFAYGETAAVPASGTPTRANFCAANTVQPFKAPNPSQTVSVILTAGTGDVVFAFGVGR